MKLRIYNIINFSEESYYNVEDLSDAVKTIDDLASAQLKNEDITDNCFFLEIFNEDNEWENWYNEEGLDIMSYELVDGVLKLIEE